jgi:SAM-dependent methyltransferase
MTKPGQAPTNHLEEASTEDAELARPLERIREVYCQRMRRRTRADARDPGRSTRTDRIKADDYRAVLERNGLCPLNSRDVLDVGCQWGSWLASCREEWGHRDGLLCGIDLMEAWVIRGRQTYDFVDLRCGSAHRLPWAENSFDLVHQAMLLSSVPDAALREAITAEMQRVVRPGGYVLWYDFFFNPINTDTVGMTLRRVRLLFPGWPVLDRARVTLAPPLSRVIGRVWGRGVNLLGKLRVFNSHYLLLLQKPD